MCPAALSENEAKLQPLKQLHVQQREAEGSMCHHTDELLALYNNFVRCPRLLSLRCVSHSILIRADYGHERQDGRDRCGVKEEGGLDMDTGLRVLNPHVSLLSAA